MDPSLPSTLMPLVCTYLSYEDTCRCMQLNSNFHKYIDENWKDMTKLLIYVKIEKLKHPYISFYYGACTPVEGGFSLEKRNEIFISYRLILVTGDTMPTFLHRYLSRQSKQENTRGSWRYRICSRAEGLRLVLETLLIRFALASIEIDFSQQQYGELCSMRSSLQYHYKPSFCSTSAEVKMEKYRPIYGEIIGSVGSPNLIIRQTDFSLSTADINHIRQNTNVIKIAVHVEHWDAESIFDFIQNWKIRNVSDVEILCDSEHIDGHNEVTKFAELCEKIGIRARENDEHFIQYGTSEVFELYRIDGQTLIVKYVEIDHHLHSGTLKISQWNTNT